MNFSELRPAAPTSLAIKEALDRARAMGTAVLEHVSSAKAQRDTMLLDGSPKELLAAEKTLTEARGDEERLEGIVLELTSRLTSTLKAEAVARTKDSLIAARDATDARRVWWEQHGQQFRDMLREVATLHTAREDAVLLTKQNQRTLFNYDDSNELIAAIYQEVPEVADVDETTWRTSAEVVDVWSWYVMFPETSSKREAA